ncbi:MAG: GNAT family N-acetyltransferase [Myxococcota bacterium]
MSGAGAFLEEVTIAASQRGRGYGRAALVAMEALLVGLGATRVDLHVYAHNPRAFALNERLGYRTTGFKMRKPLVVRAEA